jgi:hypothetical protein
MLCKVILETYHHMGEGEANSMCELVEANHTRGLFARIPEEIQWGLEELAKAHLCWVSLKDKSRVWCVMKNGIVGKGCDIDKVQPDKSLL